MKQLTIVVKPFRAEAVLRACGAAESRRQPLLMISDGPYGISLDSEWRDRAGLNGCGPAQASYMKHRTEATPKRPSRETRVPTGPSFRTGVKPANCVRLARVRLHARSSGWPLADRLLVPAADHLEQGPHGSYANALLVST